MEPTRETVEEPVMMVSDVECPDEAAASHPAPRRPAPLLNDIRLLALRKWDVAGRPTGGNARFWIEAEEELRRQA